MNMVWYFLSYFDVSSEALLLEATFDYQNIRYWRFDDA